MATSGDFLVATDTQRALGFLMVHEIPGKQAGNRLHKEK
jgi:hypothetical protein